MPAKAAHVRIFRSVFLGSMNEHRKQLNDYLNQLSIWTV
jgi:hypothetical protein